MNFKKFLYLLFKVRIHFICINKIKRIYKILNINKTLDKSIINEHVRKWSVLKKIVSPKWLEIYSYVSNKIDINYIPEDIYYTVVENTLNNSMFSLSYSDKNYYDKIDKIRGLDITICTTALNNEEALELLKNFNMPFPAEETN